MPARLTLLFLLLPATAGAVIVRGHVTTPLGAPLPGSRIQLIDLSGGPRSVAAAVSGLDGDYEIRTDRAGRFLLLTSPSFNAPLFAPQIGPPFYAGRTDLLTLDIALSPTAVTPELTFQSTLRDTPLAQLATPPTQIPADQLLTQSTPLAALAQTPSAFRVRYGQTASPAALYLRGTPITRVEIDGVSAESLALPLLPFNLATLTTSGSAAISPAPALELTPTPNPLHFLNTGAGILSLHPPAADTLHPILTLVGDAGNLSTTRAEAIASLAHTRTEALASFARLNTDNDLPAAPTHLITYAANLSYALSASTTLRFTLRDDASAAPLPIPYAFYYVQPSGTQLEQNLYSAFSLDARTAGNWHNLLRYGLARERAQSFNYFTPATGLPVTITGANGYTATGVATFPLTPPREDFVTDRDEFTYQTDRPILHSEKHPLTALLTARYQNERAADLTAVARQTLSRTHLSFAAAFQGELRHRVFYEASGLLDHSTDFGLLGTPRLGLTYVPVRPAPRRFRGTSLHATAATAVQDPTLSAQLSTNTPQIPHTRTLDFGLDQSILAQKLTLRATYFHTQNSHQPELLALPHAFSDTAAYRTQGIELTLRYQPSRSLFLDSGYTYLAALTEQSASLPAHNPSLLNISIGALTALPGARPFHRPPNTGFFAVQYTAHAVTASLKAALAGRSDDSTSLPQNPTLLLPNRNLSPGYTALDASFTYAVSHSITAYTQLNNLFDNRNIAPIGYVSTPFQLRAGLRLRLGHE